LKCWVNDLENFLKKHWNALRSNPLAVYHLFALTPKSTVFQELYTRLESFPHPVIIMGLKNDWTSGRTINPHRIYSGCISTCGNWFITGGNDEYLPVFGIWSVELGDGKTYTHPCGKFACVVSHVSFYEQEPLLRFQTACVCGLLCLWSASSIPPTLIEEIRLGPNIRHRKWSGDGSKSVTQNSSGSSSYSL
jgi:hypothetical protein